MVGYLLVDTVPPSPFLGGYDRITLKNKNTKDDNDTMINELQQLN